MWIVQKQPWHKHSKKRKMRKRNIPEALGVAQQSRPEGRETHRRAIQSAAELPTASMMGLSEGLAPPRQGPSLLYGAVTAGRP